VTLLRAGEPLIIHDNRGIATEESATFQDDRHYRDHLHAADQTRSIDRFDGHSRQGRARLWSPYELALLSEVTERSWAHIERVRADAAMCAPA
jgi:GAF domain-containing protein